MFLLNSRLGHFSAASLHWHPFSRGYGVILPSSLTTLLSLVLGFSPHLPVSVCGTGTCYLVSSFSRQCEISSFVTLFSLPITPQPYQHAVFPTCQPWCLDTVYQLRAPLSYCVTASSMRFQVVSEFQPIVHRIRFTPLLRSRLTLSGRTFLRNPWIFDGMDSHHSFATHTSILSRILSTAPYGTASACIRRSPTTLRSEKSDVRCESFSDILPLFYQRNYLLISISTSISLHDPTAILKNRLKSASESFFP